MLSILSEKKRRFFYEQHLGQTRPVLFEMHKDKGLISGFTDNYIKIEAPFQEELINAILPATLTGMRRSGNVEVSVDFSAASDQPANFSGIQTC